MTEQKSITEWIVATREGDNAAASELWNYYFHRLMRMARSKMSQIPRTTYDEEDVAISTFQVLCSKLREGRYPDLADRDELWQLMLKVLVRKILRRAEYEAALKRTSSLTKVIANSPAGPLINLADHRAVSHEIGDECERLISRLDDPNLVQLVIWKLDGFTNDEIAIKMNRTRRTVQRMLALVRNLWLLESEQ